VLEALHCHVEERRNRVGNVVIVPAIASRTGQLHREPGGPL
jgi:hypothetical protein